MTHRTFSRAFSLLAAIGVLFVGMPSVALAATPIAGDRPVITGNVTLGSELSATEGGWSSTPTVFAYQWERCDHRGEQCAAITAATESTYTIVPDDIADPDDPGFRLRVKVTADDGASAFSRPTTITEDNPVPVSIFNMPGLNGSTTNPDGTDNENTNLLSIIEVLRGYHVDGSIVSFGGTEAGWTGGGTPPDFSVTDFADALDASTFFFMTDMENSRANPSSNNFLPEDAATALRDWTDAGGVMVMTGTSGSRDVDMLNRVYSWTMANVSSSGPWTRNDTNAQGTPFADATATSLPNLSATDGVNGSTVDGFVAVYGTDTNATVAYVPYGNGFVIILGFDFFNTAAPGITGVTTYRNDGLRRHTASNSSQYTSAWVQEILPAALDFATEITNTPIAERAVRFGSAILPVLTDEDDQQATWQWPANSSAAGYVVRVVDITDETNPTMVTEETVGAGAAENETFTATGLTNGHVYALQVALVIDDLAGDFGPLSEGSLPGVPRSLTAPTVTGNTGIGGVLTVNDDVSNWRDGGFDFASVSYAWLRDGTLIDGANSSEYTATFADAGRSLIARVTRTNAEGFLSAATSAPVTVPNTLLSLLTVAPANGSDPLTLNPEFTSPQNTLNFQATVPTSVDAVVITADTAVPGATIQLNGEPLAKNVASLPQDLTIGQNTFVLTVTTSGATTTTTVQISRQSAAPPPPVQITGPVTNGTPLRPSDGTTAQIGTTPTPVTTRVVAPTTAPDSRVGTVAQVTAGSVAVTMDVTGAGRAEATANGDVAVVVQRDTTTSLALEGLRPNREAQVWLPLNGADARPVGVLAVGPDGRYTGPLSFAGDVDNRPLPIGTHVLQILAETATGELGVINVPLTIAQPPARPEPNREIGVIPTVRPGSMLVTNAGIPETVTIEPRPTERQTRIAGDSWALNIDIADESRGSMATTDDGNVLIELVQDGTAAVAGEGFMAGTTAHVWMFSTPVLLGEVTIGPDGSFSGEVAVSQELIAQGEHTLQIQGVATDGYVRAANLGVTVREPEQAPAGVESVATPELPSPADLPEQVDDTAHEQPAQPTVTDTPPNTSHVEDTVAAPNVDTPQRASPWLLFAVFAGIPVAGLLVGVFARRKRRDHKPVSTQPSA